MYLLTIKDADSDVNTAYRILATAKKTGTDPTDYRCNIEKLFKDWKKKYRKDLKRLYLRIKKAAETGIPMGCAWYTEERDEIYEFKNGTLRLFDFRGINNDLVCVNGVTKYEHSNVQTAAIDKAILAKDQYYKDRMKGQLDYGGKIEFIP